MEHGVTQPPAFPPTPTPNYASSLGPPLRAQHPGLLAAVTMPINETPLASTGYTNPSNEKLPWIVPTSNHEGMMCEAETLRQQVATLRAERQPVVGGAVATSSQSAPTSTTTESTHASSRSTDIDVTLRRELASLRVEMARLKAETEGTVRGRDPPPAYA
ncbi:hypothetical protein EVJ58_g3871 [Rhodofomes roseus]|uniref:Uncharacterized protein n=1 Tax=Rhodofomes roseus TaxID=34475 RepID=A0A4Y9YJ71_9APHY|nr:hypothetical protein EVJ58_g3871 [Rhodofomes roseus]